MVFFNPADLEYPITWNPLANVPKDRQALTVEDIVGGFRNLFLNGWGPQTEHIVRNAIGALIAAENTSLLGIRKLLIDHDYRKQILKQVSDPTVLSFWQEEFDAWTPKFRTEAIAPLQNKLGALFASPIARHILGQVQNRLDFRAMIDNRAIFIATLPKGIIGAHTSTLLGSLLVTQFQQAAMQRADTPERERIPFSLCLDEFHNFLTDSPEAFDTTLTETRKYKLFLTLAHQFTEQIPERLRHAILGNVGNVLVFRVSGHDAKLLEDEFAPEFQRRQLVHSSRGDVVARLHQNGTAGIPFAGTISQEAYERHERRTDIIGQSRRRYTQPREIVEDQVRRFLTPGHAAEKARR